MFRQRAETLFNAAGIALGGAAPWDPRIHDARFHRRVIAQGSLGLGESYMDAWWDVDDLDGMLFRLVSAGVDNRVPGFGDMWDALRARLMNLQTQRRAFEVGERHYDLGNDLYQAMLGQRLVYSCGYWRNAQDLEKSV